MKQPIRIKTTYRPIQISNKGAVFSIVWCSSTVTVKYGLFKIARELYLYRRCECIIKLRETKVKFMKVR